MISPHGVGLVARQEVRARLRTGRWKALLATWLVAVNGLALLFRLSLEQGFSRNDAPAQMFGGVLLLVLVMTLLVTPALTAQSINGDRERGTLAALQITRLSPADIAVGKLAAAWGTGLLVLALTLPCVMLPVLEGGVGVGRAVVSLAVVALLIGVVCALAQAWSALVTRSITSVLLSYLTVFVLLVGTPVLFGLGVALTSEQVERGDHAYQRERPDRVWWLLAPNPVVVLADAAPDVRPRLETITRYGPDGRPYTDVIEVRSRTDMLGGIGRVVRDTRERKLPGPDEPGGPVWPYGLAFNVLLAGGALWTTVRRLRTPVRTLPSGVRLA
ncbi:ABC transporter permease subunit [Actinomadura kijaniata]|uniref:ABC-type transport system involved in multi-copper enzyme maturation permease subunit n=1 Tax=Actinomadura namibiensis TaxID=182080 RepID=A0A7W3QP92_ACTNM|nr:ABC transporter permease [Actinomadura namibiensis]MBA8954430.1 ABC-type transport system involved in multi-copper enzyme maturation permease subunit [Actinomadura namibiensis]